MPSSVQKARSTFRSVLMPPPGTSRLAATVGRTIGYRYVAYRRRILGRGSVAHPTAHRREPARLQYALEFLKS
jgi:hypothetical protein